MAADLRFPNLRFEIFVGCLVLAVCGSSLQAEDAPAGKSIRVQVSGDSQKPVSGARVSLREWTGKYEPAQGQAVTDAEGKAEFTGLKAGYYALVVIAQGYAPWEASAELYASDVETLSIQLRPAANAWISVRDGHGRPLEGARVASISVRIPGNGLMWVRRDDAFLFNWRFQPSDADGRLDLPPLPDGATVDVVVDHPLWAQAKVVNLQVVNSRIGEAMLTQGVPATFEFVPGPEMKRPLEGSCEVLLMAASSDSPNTVNRMRYFMIDGKISLCLNPGDYRMAQFKIDGCITTPSFETHGFRVQERTSFSEKLLVRPLVPVRGRVVDPQGKPVQEADLYAEVENLTSDGATIDPAEKAYAGFTETDANGEYVSEQPPGKSRIFSRLSGRFSDQEFLEFQVREDGGNRVPDIVLSPLPTLKGRVLTAAGEPASQTLVRLRGRPATNDAAVHVDAEGRFELSVRHLPVDAETALHTRTISIAAFDPFASNAGAAEVDVRQPEQCEGIEIRLKSQPDDWLFSAFEKNLTDYERGIVTEERRKQLSAEGQRGQAAPAVDGVAWLNTDARSLEDLRGRYVLLDFWFIGCGPCHADFPSVKLVHELFASRGVVVVGVHDNSSPPDRVREHAAHEGLTFPIVVDHPDGRILEAYRKLGVRGFPSYILIDPEGKIVANDSAIPAPTLRNYKVEVIRQMLLEHPVQTDE
jgi:thiol-disulfide isomerase/thioredoxin